jgi:hypothetical protein
VFNRFPRVNVGACEDFGRTDYYWIGVTLTGVERFGFGSGG